MPTPGRKPEEVAWHYTRRAWPVSAWTGGNMERVDKVGARTTNKSPDSHADVRAGRPAAKFERSSSRISAATSSKGRRDEHPSRVSRRHRRGGVEQLKHRSPTGGAGHEWQRDETSRRELPIPRAHPERATPISTRYRNHVRRGRQRSRSATVWRRARSVYNAVFFVSKGSRPQPASSPALQTPSGGVGWLRRGSDGGRAHCLDR